MRRVIIVPSDVEKVELIQAVLTTSFADYCAIRALNRTGTASHTNFKFLIAEMGNRHHIRRDPRNIPYIIKLDPIAVYRSPSTDLHGRPCPKEGFDPTIIHRHEVRQKVQIASYVAAIYAEIPNSISYT
jgi:hypothetical protein